MKTTHTHRGTCQACGKMQAVDNVTRKLAKHGYTVSYGAFQFVCNGAWGYKPAEFDVALTRSTMTKCLTSAAFHDTEVAGLKIGTVVPETFERWNPTKVKVNKRAYGNGTYETKGDYDTLSIAKATAEERKSRIAGQIRYHELQAEGLRHHEAFLRTRVLTRLGEPLYAVVDLNRPKPVAPPVVVDVKKAKVIGAFPTKQARKDALDKLSRRYDRLRDTLQQTYLALSEIERTEAKTAIYYGPYQLSHWRPKHAEAALREFPQLANVVEEINELVKAREAVKAAP